MSFSSCSILKFLFYFILSSNICCTDSCIRWGYTGKVDTLPWEPAPKYDRWWEKLHQSFVHNTKTNADKINVLFYGDSITEGWGDEGQPTYLKYYSPLGAANYGISGDRTEHLLWRIQNGEVQNLQPKVIVLMIGTNNMYRNYDSDIAKGIYAVVRELRHRLPKSKILLVGILPRSSAMLTSRVIAINNFISQLDDGEMIRYFDMTEHFYEGNGEFQKGVFHRDLLHLSSKGYEVWAHAMEPKFRQMLF